MENNINSNILNDVEVEDITIDDETLKLGEDVESWLLGKKTDVPDSLRNLSTGMIDKINFSMNAVLASYIRRAIVLQAFVEKAEKQLYTEENLLKLEKESIASLTKEANKNLTETTEFIRKYMLQNKEFLSKTDEKTDLVKDLIMSLPSDSLDKLLTLLQSGEL